MREFIAMSSAHVRIVFAIAAATMFASGVARAQDAAAPIPDSSYSDNYQSPPDLPMPPADNSSDTNTVTIPIPGGGEITVEGPDAPDDASLNTTPGTQWGEQQQTPDSPDLSPLGP